MNANLTCRLQEDEDEETSMVGSDLEEEEEEVQQPILAIGGGRRPFEGHPEITWCAKAYLKAFSKLMLPLQSSLLYYSIYYYSIEHQDFRL